MLPPTRARSGGRGLSLSLFSCLLDCRRPPGEQPATDPQAGVEGSHQHSPNSKTLGTTSRSSRGAPQPSLNWPSVPTALWQPRSPTLILTLPFGSLLKVLVLILRADGILGLIVRELILPLCRQSAEGPCAPGPSQTPPQPSHSHDNDNGL